MSILASQSRLKRPPLPRGPPEHFALSQSVISQFTSALKEARDSAPDLKPLTRKSKPSNNKTSSHDKYAKTNGVAFKVPSLPSLPTSQARSLPQLPFKNPSLNKAAASVVPVSPGVGKLRENEPWPKSSQSNKAVANGDFSLGVSRGTRKKEGKKKESETGKERRVRIQRKLGIVKWKRQAAENETLYQFRVELKNAYDIYGNPKACGLEPLTEKRRKRENGKDKVDEEERRRERKRRKTEEAEEKVKQKEREKDKEKEKRREKDRERRKERERGDEKHRRRKDRGKEIGHSNEPTEVKDKAEWERRKEKLRREKGNKEATALSREKSSEEAKDSVRTDRERSASISDNERKERRHRDKDRRRDSGKHDRVGDVEKVSKRNRDEYEESDKKKDKTRNTPSPRDDFAESRKKRRSTPSFRSVPNVDDRSSGSDSRRSSPEGANRKGTKASISFRSRPAPVSPGNSSSGSGNARKTTEDRVKRESAKKQSAFAPVDEEEMRLREKSRKMHLRRSVSPQDVRAGSPSVRRASRSPRDRPALSSVPNPHARKDANSPSEENIGTPAFSPPGGSGKAVEQKQATLPRGKDLKVPVAQIADAADVVKARDEFVRGKEEVDKLIEKGKYAEAEKLGIKVFAKAFKWATAKETQHRRRRVASSGSSEQKQDLRREAKFCEELYHYIASGFAKRLMNTAERGGRKEIASTFRRNVSKAYGRMFIMQRVGENEKKSRLMEAKKIASSFGMPKGFPPEAWRTLTQSLTDQLSATNYYELSSAIGSDGGEEAGNECRMM